MKIEGRRPEPPVRSAERSVKDEGKGFDAMLAAFARTEPTAAPLVRGDARRGRAEGARAPEERLEERDVEQTRGERETLRGDSRRAEASDRGRGRESASGRTHDARETERAERDRERALDRAAAGANTAKARGAEAERASEGSASVADGELADAQDERSGVEAQSGSSDVAGVTSEATISAWMRLDEHPQQVAHEHLRRAEDAPVAHRSAVASELSSASRKAALGAAPAGLFGAAASADQSASSAARLDVAGAAGAEIFGVSDAIGRAPRALSPVGEGAASFGEAAPSGSGEGAASFGEAAPSGSGEGAAGKGVSQTRSPDGTVSIRQDAKLATPHLAPESPAGASAALGAGLYSREGGANGLVAAGKERRAAKASSEPSLTNLTQTAAAAPVTRGAPSATDVATQQPNVGEALARAGSQLVHEDSTIRLTHPELGRMSLQLDVDSEVLEVRAVTESALAASLLAESEESLRRDLARHGVELRRLKVQREAEGEGQSGRSGRDDRERPDGEGGSPQRRLRERG